MGNQPIRAREINQVCDNLQYGSLKSSPLDKRFGTQYIPSMNCELPYFQRFKALTDLQGGYSLICHVWKVFVHIGI